MTRILLASVLLLSCSPTPGAPRVSGACANADGDLVPCAYLKRADCDEACQRAKCHAAGSVWRYTDTPLCRLRYFSGGGPDIAFGEAPCGRCEIDLPPTTPAIGPQQKPQSPKGGAP
jgi:hypothetical protein